MVPVLNRTKTLRKNHIFLKILFFYVKKHLRATYPTGTSVLYIKKGPCGQGTRPGKIDSSICSFSDIFFFIFRFSTFSFLFNHCCSYAILGWEIWEFMDFSVFHVSRFCIFSFVVFVSFFRLVVYLNHKISHMKYMVGRLCNLGISYFPISFFHQLISFIPLFGFSFFSTIGFYL